MPTRQPSFQQLASDLGQASRTNKDPTSDARQPQRTAFQSAFETVTSNPLPAFGSNPDRRPLPDDRASTPIPVSAVRQPKPTRQSFDSFQRQPIRQQLQQGNVSKRQQIGSISPQLQPQLPLPAALSNLDEETKRMQLLQVNLSVYTHYGF